MIELEKIKPGTTNIRVNIKDGLDGAGNHIEMKGGYQSMVTMGFVVLDIWDLSDPDPAMHRKIWENPFPNSNFSFKPLAMVLGTETEDLLEFMTDKFPFEQPQTTVRFKGAEMGVKLNILRTMVDKLHEGSMQHVPDFNVRF